MGIIKATAIAICKAVVDRWKEMFCAGEMSGDPLMTQIKKLTGERGNNESMSEVITDAGIDIPAEHKDRCNYTGVSLRKGAKMT